MRIPRWTTYPAVALLALVLVMAIPNAPQRQGEAQRARARFVERERAMEPAPERVHNAAVPQAAQRGEDPPRVFVVDHLPPHHVTDGSVDYRAEVQEAMDAAAGGSLTLPDFPVRIGRAPGKPYGLIARGELRVYGNTTSTLFTREPGLQLLRGELVKDFLLQGFSVHGIGGHGKELTHGLVQITGGSNVQVRNLRISSTDADGLAIAQVDGVHVERVTVELASKAGIYLAACRNAVVRDNVVREFGGHYLQFGDRVGVGLQLSSCKDVLASANKITDGLGVGILCNALQGGAHPEANTLTLNQVRDVANPDNPNVSGGIRLANGATSKETRTHVYGNTIWSCGANGVYVENHGGAVVSGNLVQKSSRAGVVVSTILGATIENNVILESGSGHEAIEEINGARSVRARDNVLGDQD